MNKELIKNLADFTPTEMPVLSVYLDMRPQATGGNPGVRSGEIVLKDRLHEIEKTYLPRGADLDSFRADRKKIEEFVENKMSKATSGLIIFACSAANLWEIQETGAELENEVAVGTTPSLFQFAKLLGDYETAVVAVVDTNTARFFVTNYGKLKETDAPDDPNTQLYNKTSGGGWNQMKYQRIVENKRDEFSKEVVKDLEALIEKVGAKNLIIAGDEIAMTLLQNNLSPQTREILYSEVLRIDEKTPRLEIKEAVQGILAEIEKDNAKSQIEKLIGAVRENSLGVAGINLTKKALENGQVETLLLDPQSETLDHDTRNELIRLAETTGAKVEMIEDNEKFAAMQGVGGLLRYKLESGNPAKNAATKAF
jgi:hypothetical protein